MKKTSILIAMFAVAMAVSAARADEVKVDFDKPGSKSVNTYIMDMDGSAINTPQPQLVVELTATERASIYKNRLILVKDILNEITAKDRAEFVSDIGLADGEVSSQKYALLERIGFSASKVDEIAMAFAPAADHDSYKSVSQRPETRIGELLLGLPEEIKEDFFDNLRFLNGSIVSAKTNLLEKAAGPEKFEKMLSTIMPATQGINNTKEIRNDEACNASTGAKNKSVIRGCDYQPGYTCNPSKCK